MRAAKPVRQPGTKEEDGGVSETESTDEIELLAEVDGAVVGSAGIGCVGRREKTRHRARFGISVDKAYWGLGIGPVRTVSQRAPFRRVAEKDFMGGRKT